MLVKLRNSFIAGITVLLPAVLTFIIVRYLLTTIDIYLLNPIVEFLKPYLSLYWMKYIAKALVLIIIFLSICLLGMAARNIIMSRLFRSMEKLFIKVPLVGRVYRAIKEISNAFLGEGRTIFHRVILLEYPRKGLYSIGFITRKGKGEVQQKTGKKVLSVFVPTTPNPTSGIYLLVPEEEIISLDMTVEEGLKLVISGGSVMPEFKLEGKSLR